MRGKIMLSLVLVAIGAALAAGGPTALLVVVSFGWRNAAVLLFVLGVVALLSGIVPPGTLAGPAVFVLLGLGVVLMRSGFSDTFGRFGIAAALVGMGLVLAAEPGPRRALHLRRRRWVVLFPRRATVSSVPPRVRLVAVGNRFALDFSEARCQRTVVEFFLSSWCGHVTLVLPPNWTVVAGRLTARAASGSRALSTPPVHSRIRTTKFWARNSTTCSRSGTQSPPVATSW